MNHFEGFTGQCACRLPGTRTVRNTGIVVKCRTTTRKARRKLRDVTVAVVAEACGLRRAASSLRRGGGGANIAASSTSVRLFVTIPSPPFKFDQFQKLRGLGSATGVQQPLLISRPPAPRACSAKGWSPNNPEGAFSACFQRGRELRRRRQFQSIRDQFPQIFRGCVGCGFPKYRHGCGAYTCGVPVARMEPVGPRAMQSP